MTSSQIDWVHKDSIFQIRPIKKIFLDMGLIIQHIFPWATMKYITTRTAKADNSSGCQSANCSWLIKETKGK